jgi:TonB family protein
VLTPQHPTGTDHLQDNVADHRLFRSHRRLLVEWGPSVTLVRFWDESLSQPILLDITERPGRRHARNTCYSVGMRWLMLLFAINAVAQEIPHTTSPRILSKVEPQYSEEARIGRLEGTVIVRAVIGADGIPADMRIIQSLGLGLDQEAALCIQQWRFQPETSHGEAISSNITVEVNFRTMTDPKSGHLSSAKFEVPTGAYRPILLSAKFPRAFEPSSPVTLLFEVSKDGSVAFVRAKGTGTSEWQHDLIEALEEWKFKPAMKDGLPIRVPSEFTFTLP